MILTFSKQQFVERILSGTKIHTIREDKNRRWRVGRSIQFWYGNPRNKKNNPYQFASGRCIDIKEIEIDFLFDAVTFENGETISGFKELDQFAVNDGFVNWDFMRGWFFDTYKGYNTTFKMRLIYFVVQ